MSSTIPRFLLPRGSAIWRWKATSSSGPSQLRTAASKQKPSQQHKQRVLEKPTKFNPPSHGSRLRSNAPRNYPGPLLSAEEIARNSKKSYPNMMPPDGTFLHWFLNSRSFHLYFTLGVLSLLAGFSFITNFKQTSKFADLLPPASEFIWHPISAIRQCTEVLKLHTAAVAAETAERRQRSVDDVAKRDLYRKAHGLNTDGFGGWSAKANSELLGPAIGNAGPVGENVGPVANGQDAGLGEQVQQQQGQQYPKKPLKKWLGIW